VVDSLAAASAWAEYLVVLQPGDGVLGSGAALAEPLVVAVADDASVGAAPG
jgi:hypothetical protein